VHGERAAENGRSLRRAARPPRRRTLPGHDPGSPVLDPQALPSRMRVVAYGAHGCEVLDDVPLAELGARLAQHPVLWIQVQGLGDRGLLQGVAAAVGMHPLALEDVVHTHQRPKLEEYGEHLFAVLRAPGEDGLHRTQQVTAYVGARFCVSFEEMPSPLLESVRDRVLRGSGRMHKDGADYLFYSLLDAVLDAYFPVVEVAGDRLDLLEAETMRRQGEGWLARIYELKRDLSILRREVWPHRDLANRLARGEFDLVDEETRVFFRDCYDHTVQVLDQLEQLRDVAAGLMELQVSLVGNRMNEIMRVLTIISTIFIPLTFVVGVYGMNFDPDSSSLNMPELRARYGYPVVMGGMALCAALMWLWFKRQGWVKRGTR
jgi:magnesium transporter